MERRASPPVHHGPLHLDSRIDPFARTLLKTRFPLRVKSTIRRSRIRITNRFYFAEPTGEDARRSINAKHQP